MAIQSEKIALIKERVGSRNRERHTDKQSKTERQQRQSMKSREIRVMNLMENTNVLSPTKLKTLQSHIYKWKISTRY